MKAALWPQSHCYSLNNKLHMHSLAHHGKRINDFKSFTEHLFRRRSEVNRHQMATLDSPSLKILTKEESLSFHVEKHLEC